MTAGSTSRAGAGRTLAIRTVPVVPAAIAAVVSLRMPLLARPATSDEGGYLVLASQWHAGGSSLYGDYWVDRPPLLLAIFQLADLAGGLVALRLIGALAAAVTVGLLAATARRAFGASAARWTAFVAAALLVSPLFGSEVVNGELLSAPFLALGIRLAVEAVLATDPRTVRVAALGTGLAAVLALLVKQNMADAVVFAAVCWLAAWHVRRISGRTCARLVALAVAGAVIGYVVVMLWAMSRGTSPWAAYEATYPFRVDAGRVLAEGASNLAQIRLGRLALAALLSGAVVVLVAFLVVVPRRTTRDPVVWAITATACFATVSVLSGGSYWLHYLVEALPAVALAAGALSAHASRSAPRLTLAVTSFVVLSAVVALTAFVVEPEPAPGAVVGRTLARAASPGDTVLSAFGDPDILHASGLSSPYPYLWSLPSRTLDPDLTLLRGVLTGPEAPTWIVVRSRHAYSRLDASSAWSIIEARYEVVGQFCGRTVYLQRDLDRPGLKIVGSCGGLVLP